MGDSSKVYFIVMPYHCRLHKLFHPLVAYCTSRYITGCGLPTSPQSRVPGAALGYFSKNKEIIYENRYAISILAQICSVQKCQILGS